MRITYSSLQTGYVRVIRSSVFQDLSQQQWVFHQAWARDVQEAPEVQLPAERRLQAALQEVLDPPVLLLLVQQGFGCQLVAAVLFVTIQTRQLRKHSDSYNLFTRWNVSHLKMWVQNLYTYPVYNHLSNLRYCSIRASSLCQFHQ